MWTQINIPQSSFHVLSTKIACSHSFVHSFTHSFIPSLQLSAYRSLTFCRAWCWGKYEKDPAGPSRTRPCPSPEIPGLCGECPRARWCGAGFRALSQSNENRWTTNDDGGPAATGTACSKPARHRGLFSPPGSLCHLLSSMRQFNLELSQGEGGRDVRGHLNSP